MLSCAPAARQLQRSGRCEDFSSALTCRIGSSWALLREELGEVFLVEDHHQIAHLAGKSGRDPEEGDQIREHGTRFDRADVTLQHSRVRRQKLMAMRIALNEPRWDKRDEHRSLFPSGSSQLGRAHRTNGDSPHVERIHIRPEAVRFRLRYGGAFDFDATADAVLQDLTQLLDTLVVIRHELHFEYARRQFERRQGHDARRRGKGVSRVTVPKIGIATIAQLAASAQARAFATHERTIASEERWLISLATQWMAIR